MHHSIQVLSESVSKALQEVRGEEVAETAKFCLMMDRFFDSLNVTNYSEGYEKLKPYRMPYRSVEDFRFKVCVYVYVILGMHISMYKD